jgi:heme A synthase
MALTEAEIADITEKIAAQEAHIGWLRDQVSLADDMFHIFFIATVVVLLLVLALALMSRRKGGHEAGGGYSFLVLVLIFLVVAVALTLVAIKWQYPAEINAAQNSIEQLRFLLDTA